jgi:hypothetical protein
MNNTKSIVDLSAKLNKYQQRATHGDISKRELYNRKVAQYRSELGNMGAQSGGNVTKTLTEQQRDVEKALEDLKQSIGFANNMTTDPNDILEKMSGSVSKNVSFTDIDDILNNAIAEAKEIGSR